MTAVRDKIKSFQKDLETERRKLFEDFNNSVAERIWLRTKREMQSYYSELVQKEAHKLSKAISINHREVETTRLKPKGRNRRFRRSMRTNRPKRTEAIEQSAQALTLPELPTLEAINLTSTILTESEKDISAKGPSLCPQKRKPNIPFGTIY